MLPKSTSRKHLLALGCTILSYVFCTGQNAIYLENQNPGVPFSTWGIVPDSFRAHNIAGFSTQQSVNAGQTVHFKVDVFDGHNFTMKIYRIGYYNGNGARLMADLGTLPGVHQPIGIQNISTGLYDCDNWSESASWAIPSNAVSGLYIARIDRVGTGGGSNHIAFIVRNDASTSDLFLQFPDATWQAYNMYGGSSVYDGTTPGFPNNHAVKVSYNRPYYITTAGAGIDGRGSNWYMNAEYPMIRWLERNGYDVTYTDCADVSANLNHILNHKVYISVGHDEYVSKQQRQNIEAARNAGVHLAFFTGNEVYWKTRYENDNSGDAMRTLVCYKEGLLADGSPGERACGGKCDLTSPEWTGLWRTGAAYDAGLPENTLTGQLSWTELPGDIEVPAYYKKLRFWRNIPAIAALTGNNFLTLAPNTLGYEWDYEQGFETMPPGRITMSSTTISGLTHKLSLYRHPSGALVFGAGTIQWSWGLDDGHFGGSPVTSSAMQQATVNLFADMGAQPFSLQAGLVAATASSDLVAPVSAFTFPTPSANLAARSTVTVTGTAIDASGVVAAIEVSVDGGTTWKQATLSALDNNITWSYSWIPEVQGSVNLKVRSVDDSGNREVAGAGVTVVVTPPVCPCTIMSDNTTPFITNTTMDDHIVTLGVKFRPNVNGTITGIRFYKTDMNTGTHIGDIWTNGGTNLGNVTFTGETATGWQTATFATPIDVVAGTTYIASYFVPNGHFAKTSNFFSTQYPAGSNWPIQALATPLNGVFRDNAYGVPNEASDNGENFFVDVVFSTTVSTVTTLNGSVTLQGRPAAPNAQWAVPLIVDFYTTGVPTPVATFNVTTDNNGNFSINNAPLGTYNIAVKNAHTLRVVKTAQAMVPGGVSISFGTLNEGDANGDNFVSAIDLGMLLSSYNKATGDPGFIVGADLNNDGFVTAIDLGLILTNYNSAGQIP